MNQSINVDLQIIIVMIMIFTIIGPGGIVLAVAGNCAKVGIIIADCVTLTIF